MFKNRCFNECVLTKIYHKSKEESICKRKSDRQTPEGFAVDFPDPFALQRPFVPAECRHPVHVTVADLMFQRGDDLVFPGEETGA